MSMEIFGVFLAVAKELQNTPKLQFLSYPGTVLGAGGGDGGQDCVEFQPGSGYLSKFTSKVMEKSPNFLAVSYHCKFITLLHCHSNSVFLMPINIILDKRGHCILSLPLTDCEILQ